MVGVTLAAVMVVCIGRLAYKKIENLIVVTPTDDIGVQRDFGMQGAGTEVRGEGELDGSAREGSAPIQAETEDRSQHSLSTLGRTPHHAASVGPLKTQASVSDPVERSA